MSLIKACIIGNSVKNSGFECSVAMGATAMLLVVPPSTVISVANLADPLGWARPLIHASKATRIYPLFGSSAPINNIQSETESDVEVTLDDGTKVRVRSGVYNRIYETLSGGLCFAEALFSFIASGYRVIEIDQQGKMLLHSNETTPKTWGGMITSYMAGYSPKLATLKEVYLNRFGYSFTPQELVNSGEIFNGAGDLLQLLGLIDAEIKKGITPSTVTKLYIGVSTLCAENDLVALLGTPLGTFTNNFIVTNKVTGVVMTITAAAIVSGQVELTGTFVSSQTYNVIGNFPSVWYTNLARGYDASEHGVDILIP